MTTAVIIARDRVTYTKQCVEALALSPGVDDIHIVDHDSRYGPMLDYLGKVGGWYGRRDGDGIRVHVHWQANAHPRALWSDGTLHGIVAPGERFVVTDHDVIPPTGVDWLSYLHAMLDDRPDVVKAGLQLRLDDLPVDGKRTMEVLDWEAQFRAPRVPWRIPEPGRPGWAQASVDTTLALYRGLERFAIDSSLRTVDHRLQARHLSWYEDEDHLTEEQRFYRERAEYGHWRSPDGFTDLYALGG